eukprot:gene4678-6387_t
MIDHIGIGASDFAASRAFYAAALAITSLASEFKDPKRFIGVHFFSP